jgi:hypothetical protein
LFPYHHPFEQLPAVFDTLKDFEQHRVLPGSLRGKRYEIAHTKNENEFFG